MTNPRKPFFEVDADSFTLSSFDTKPIDGYKAAVNKETGEVFPNCCPFHKSVLQHSEKWFELFPNCCDPHKKFNGKPWFNKTNYTGVPIKIINQLAYTEHHIQQQINKPDWYTDITDYIEYNALSFGHPAVGFHIYLERLKDAVQNTTFEIESSKRSKLESYIESFYSSGKDASAPDLNALYATYKDWLDIFPFELNTYFGSLKPVFTKQFPVISELQHVNKYTGQGKFKMHSKESFIELLIELTDKLLREMNGATLLEKGLITDVGKLKLELAITSRKQKLKDGYNYNSPDPHTRIKRMIKYWFRDEKEFIDEISPLIKEEPSQETDTSTKEPSTGIKKNLADLFAVSDWEKYVEALRNCSPPLLSNDNSFIGSQQKHKGVVATWFKFLKTKGIVHQSINRDELAGILSNQIKNYRISGASIDNESLTYRKFEDQLLKLCNLV